MKSPRAPSFRALMAISVWPAAEADVGGVFVIDVLSRRTTCGSLGEHGLLEKCDLVLNEDTTSEGDITVDKYEGRIREELLRSDEVQTERQNR
ncbi:hypothetical protein EVAR_911_1 [Eumeta japonica]|uniref:Uncharacterized protein n=1 Tax=Eumeta variegata TaxID=151549 RepID=A0A4C1SDY8_EUMVA|nr:hypothetical protein EVAR_911_1 [Eumeta japonica]